MKTFLRITTLFMLCAVSINLCAQGALVRGLSKIKPRSITPAVGPCVRPRPIPVLPHMTNQDRTFHNPVILERRIIRPIPVLPDSTQLVHLQKSHLHKMLPQSDSAMRALIATHNILLKNRNLANFDSLTELSLHIDSILFVKEIADTIK